MRCCLKTHRLKEGKTIVIREKRPGLIDSALRRGDFVPNKVFRRQVIISSILTVTVIVIIAVFCVSMFKKYTPPNVNNTSLGEGKVVEVYLGVPSGGVTLVMSNGESLGLVTPTLGSKFYSAIGYNVNELADLLEGKSIQYRRMDRMPWVVEIYVDDIKIDNTKLTNEQMISTRVGVVILGLIMLAIAIAGDVEYLQSKYKCYRKAQKKQKRKAQRA